MLRKPKAGRLTAKHRFQKLRSKIWKRIEEERAKKRFPERIRHLVHVEPMHYRLLQGARDALSIKAPRLWLPEVISDSLSTKKWAFTHQKVSPGRYSRIAKRAIKQRWFEDYSKFVKRGLVQKSPFFLLKLPKEKFEIIRKLNRHGIVAEGILKHGEMGNDLYLARNLGQSVETLVKKPFKRSMPYLLQVAKTLGQVHALKIVHRHPHLGNFIALPKGEIGVIDFKFAKQVEVDWHSADSIGGTFFDDLYDMFLLRVGKRISLNPKQKRELISAVVAQYPISNGVRKELLNKLFLVFECKS